MTVWTKLHNERQERDSIVKTVGTLRQHLDEAIRLELTSRTQKMVASSRTPIERFLYRSEERRKKRLEEYAAKNTPPFCPTILPSSRRIAAGRKDAHRNAHERLYAQGRKSSGECDSTGESIDNRFSSNPFYDGSFMKRQAAYQVTRSRNMEIRKRHETQSCSFHPNIGTKSETLAINSRLEQNVVERLAVNDLQRRESNAFRRELLAEPECSFVPQIDSLSNAIACMRNLNGNLPVHDRLFQTQDKSFRARSSSAGSDRIIPMRNPKPASSQSNNPYMYVPANYNLRNPAITLAVIDRAHREKDMKRILQIQEREERELAECTFQPNIRKTRPESAKPILVSGLDRFLETKEKARRASAHGKVRALREYDDSMHNGAITIPSPFPFSNNRTVN